ncbi:MAG: PIN domain-containing protein [Kiritimatiellae bacterium]|nr:PIN domain-containing protein [Kiritimatiellia bacterium]
MRNRNCKSFRGLTPAIYQPVTQSIAERWGYVKASLAKNGTPIPDNDIWIAATALETGARLISYDSHFDSVGGLIRLSP